MRKIILLYFLFLSISGFGQTISVSSFKLLDTDLTANTAGTMEQDQNGETAALIKVVTTQTGFTFDGGSLGIVKTVQKPSEIWVYVPRGLKKITISHPQLGMLRDYYLNIPIEAARTYEMMLVAGEVQTVVKQARTSQYVVFQLTPPDAVVELNGELLKTEGGVASKMMKFGTYNYRVQAPDYLLEAGSVTIDDPNNKKVVNISLKPNFAKVTINVDNNAEIWVNGEKKGVGSWSGNLGAGTYELEAKKQGHRSTTTTQDFIVTSEPQIVKLQAPIPIYGEADINSSPGMADIFIDGKKVGQTPQLVSNILEGPHEIKISKKGYEDYVSQLIINEKETKSFQATLKEKKMPVEKTNNQDNIVFTSNNNKALNLIGYINSQEIIQAMPEYTKALQASSKEKMESITLKVINATKTVGRDGGFSIIYDCNSGIPFINNSHITDVTSLVKKELKLISTANVQIKEINNLELGFVNSLEIIQAMPEYTKAESEIKVLQSQYEAELKRMQDELQRKGEAFDREQAYMSDNTKQRRQQELQEMYQKIQQSHQDSQQALQKASEERMQTLTSKVQNAIKAVGQESGFSIIFEKDSGPFINNSHITDVTSLVKKELKLISSSNVYKLKIDVKNAKFGYIDTQSIFQDMPEYTKAESEIKALQSQYEADLKSMQDELQKKSDAFSREESYMSDNIKLRRQQELQEMYQKIQQSYQDNNQALQKTAAEKMQAITTKVLDAIKSVGQAGDYVLINENNSLPYISNTLSTDVTAQVKTKLGLR